MGKKADGSPSRIGESEMDAVATSFDIEVFSRCLTFSLFVLAGYDLSKSLPRPKGAFGWVLLVLAAFGAAFIGINVRLVSIFGMGIYLDMILLGGCCGFIVGFLVRERPRFKTR
ncbi:MAG TPA: hypothetical protein VI758_11090 [Bacteroidota bacterium]